MHVEVVPQQLCQLAETCRAAAADVDDGWNAAQGTLEIDGSAAGNTQGGAQLVAAHQGAVAAAGLAAGRMASVLEHDMDALYQCAFDFSGTDEQVAESFETTLLAGLFGG